MAGGGGGEKANDVLGTAGANGVAAVDDHRIQEPDRTAALPIWDCLDGGEGRHGPEKGRPPPGGRAGVA
ncbi:hypothetical protein EDD27_9375 [Nonomuraea polychroma]|uniref:Uncharacterized protein n=1 Tax=Nonomuraea polychroma TaxID=46176 RepID=A0A438MLM2_9ACTN|nr:hypothetical protein EDD27_9375 [Nonomuraea polychroma]